MSGTVLFIQHHSYAPPAMLGEAFAEAGYDVEVLAIPDTKPGTVEFPGALAYDAIVPLGAIVSVYDPDLVKSWVGAEMALLREADAAGVPVLGVCFGGQLLAQAYGGTVGQSPVPEIGWYQVTSDHPAVVPEGPWFQWHSDRWNATPRCGRGRSQQQCLTGLRSATVAGSAVPSRTRQRPPGAVARGSPRAATRRCGAGHPNPA